VKLHLLLPGCMHVAAISQPWEWDTAGADVVAVAREAERLGFESLLIPEHYLTANTHLDHLRWVGDRVLPVVRAL
jgi:alkanesulfonate monooxygenase SsuD/methylene tetrahydromethanopterin reductase-like flavin-dependent oxidoreductase (luciferase family)